MPLYFNNLVFAKARKLSIPLMWVLPWANSSFELLPRNWTRALVDTMAPAEAKTGRDESPS